MKNVRKRNAMLESIRGLACILVVLCHFKIKSGLGMHIIAFARFSVPFFLILSGYFSLKSSDEENIAFAKRKLLATSRLLAIGILVCITSNTIQCMLRSEEPFKWFIDVISLETIFNFIIFNRANWLSSVMYYLFMMIYVYTVYIFMNKLNLMRIAYYFVPVLLMINVLVSKKCDNWYYAGNFLITGFPFFTLV